MRRVGNEWPVERSDLLKTLWADGLSAGQIAAELGGGLTRNAVIGKVNRLGLMGRSKSTCSTSRTPRQRRVPTPHGHWQTAKAAGATVIDPELPPTPIVDDEIPLAQRKQFLELKEHHCRWIIGDPLKEGHFYCGHESADLYGGRPYCATHRARAKGTAITITEAERLRRTMQGKKNHVSKQANAA